MTDLSHDGQNLSHELITIFISIIIFCLVIATPYATSDGYFLLLLLPDVGPRKSQISALILYPVTDTFLKKYCFRKAKNVLRPHLEQSKACW